MVGYPVVFGKEDLGLAEQQWEETESDEDVQQKHQPVLVGLLLVG